VFIALPAKFVAGQRPRRQYGRMRAIRPSVNILVLLLASSAVFATPLFSRNEVINARLAGPLAPLMREVEEPVEMSFVFSLDGIDHDIKVRLRGKSRLRVCKLKPVRLNFRKSEIGATLLVGQDKLKLVVPCEWSSRAEKDLLEEYLAYRIFNLLTPMSYRVRLLRIEFVDTGDKPDGVAKQRHAFVIEPVDQLADRIDARPSSSAEISLGRLDPQHAALVYVFQYLVANTDWSMVSATGKSRCCHNGTILERNDRLFYVPYDFDLAGLVNAPYAEPAPELKLRSVKRRRYRGFCTDRQTLADAVHLASSQQEAISELIQALPVLTDRDKKRRTAYLGAFFEEAANPDKLIQRFEDWCID
jgi:hypothetical protein